MSAAEEHPSAGSGHDTATNAEQQWAYWQKRAERAEAEVSRLRAQVVACEALAETGRPGWTGVARRDLHAALSDPGPVLAQVKAEAPSVSAQFLALHEGTCPKCGEHRFIGHGPLCLDCIQGGDDARA